MNSIGTDCNELKKQYDACFNSWFSERFLKGDTDDTPCQPIFKVYQHCVKEALKVHNLEFTELEKDHLGHPEREFKKPTDKNGGKAPAS